MSAQEALPEKFSSQTLTLREVSQQAWAAQGITSSQGYRTCPSAGALYPLELLIIAANVLELEAGVYRYAPQGHELIMVLQGDLRPALAEAGLMQSSIRNGAADFLLTAFYEKTTRKYGRRGIQYVRMEAGHAAQNVCLQAIALGLGAVMIGAFHDDRVKEAWTSPETKNRFISCRSADNDPREFGPLQGGQHRADCLHPLIPPPCPLRQFTISS